MAVNKTDLHPVYYDAVENRPEQLDANYERESRERRVANLRLLWNRRGLAARAAGVGLVLSVVVAFLIPTRFESTARLMPPDQPSSGMGLAMLAAGSAAGGASGSALGSQLGGLGSVAGDLLGIKNSSDLFIGVLQSRTIQDDLINKFDLKKEYSDRRMEDARLDLSTHTDISTDRKTGIITIQVIDHSPQKAAAMAAEYIGELNLVVSQLNTSSAHRERVFLEDRLAQVKEDLESSENRFSEFASNNTAIDVPAQGKAMIEAAATLEGELIAAQTELQGLKQVYSDENVRVRATKARVDEIQRQLQRIGGKFDDDPASGTNGDQSMFPSIKQLPKLGVSYADLFRNTKIQETTFAVLTQQYELAKVQEAKDTPSVKVLDPPDVPEKKIFPPRMLIALLGAMLAFTGSLVWVFGKQSWDHVEPSDPQKLFAQEMVRSVRAQMRWLPENGTGPHARNGDIVVRPHQDDDDEERSDIDQPKGAV